jgi:dihydropyrimidine dehydrogenase (NAD+) subunit PreA
VDLDKFVPYPVVGKRSTNGGYCGPAVKPIALHMVAALARDPRITVPISGIGGITTWRDAAEFIALGATSVQVCTAAMHYGFRIVEDMIDGLVELSRREGHEVGEASCAARRAGVRRMGRPRSQLQGRRARRSEACIGCNLCYVACKDTR